MKGRYRPADKCPTERKALTLAASLVYYYMKIIFGILATIVLIPSCKVKKAGNCYPKEKVAKTVILAADTVIFGRYLIPERDVKGIVNVFYGVGFVKPDGVPVHKPLKTLTLSGELQEDFLRIFREVPASEEGTTTDCIPYYRHVALFYNEANKLVGQVQICFSCEQVEFSPKADCLNYFDNVRTDELRNFFKKHDIPIMEN